MVSLAIGITEPENPVPAVTELDQPVHWHYGARESGISIVEPMSLPIGITEPENPEYYMNLGFCGELDNKLKEKVKVL